MVLYILLLSLPFHGHLDTHAHTRWLDGVVQTLPSDFSGP